MKRILSILITLFLCLSVFVGCEKNNELQDIHSQVYDVKEVTYQNGMYSFTIIAGENSPIYAISEDMQLSSQKEYGEPDEWTNLGKLEKIELTKDIFDDLFRGDGWVDGQRANRIRKDNANAWQLLYNQEHLYYVLQQKNGDLYLAYGYYDYSEKDDAYSDDTLIRWLFKLAVAQNGLALKDFEMKNATGTRIYDAYHPDDSERYPYFSVTLSALNNATVEHKEDSKIYVDGEYLLGGSGNGCNSFYLSDLTGDSVPELCFGMNFGSGIVDQRIEIVDYATKETLFSLSDRGTNDYYLFLRNGILCVKETEYMKHDAVRTGVLTYNGSEISVAWDSEVNATVDRDNSPAPGEPVS